MKNAIYQNARVKVKVEEDQQTAMQKWQQEEQIIRRNIHQRIGESWDGRIGKYKF